MAQLEFNVDYFHDIAKPIFVWPTAFSQRSILPVGSCRMLLAMPAAACSTGYGEFQQGTTSKVVK